MNEIERTIRKTDLKEASRMDASEEYGVLLKEFCKIDGSEKGLSPEEAWEEAKRNYTKVFGRILPTDSLKVISECAGRIEEVTRRIEETIKTDGFSKKCFKTLVECEVRLNLAWGILMVEASSMAPKDEYPEYYKYEKEEIKPYTEAMFNLLYENVDDSTSDFGLSLTIWEKYYEQEIKTNHRMTEYIRESVENMDMLDLSYISLLGCFLFYPRSRFLACKYLQSQIKE